MCTDISADMSADISVVCRPSVGRVSIETRSTYLPCIDRVSVEYRSIHRPISRSMCRPMYRSRPPIRYMIRISYGFSESDIDKRSRLCYCSTVKLVPVSGVTFKSHLLIINPGTEYMVIVLCFRTHFTLTKGHSQPLFIVDRLLIIVFATVINSVFRFLHSSKRLFFNIFEVLFEMRCIVLSCL